MADNVPSFNIRMADSCDPDMFIVDAEYIHTPMTRQELLDFADRLTAILKAPSTKAITDSELGKCINYWLAKSFHDQSLMNHTTKYFVEITISLLKELEAKRAKIH